jgi:hypothetical protein
MILGCAVGQPRAEAAAKEIVQQAWDAPFEDEDRTALRLYDRVASDYPFTAAWIEAMHMSGRIHSEQGRREYGLARYHELLRMAHRDWREPDLLFSFHGEQHDACKELSTYYEAIGDAERALKYAVLASEYPYAHGGCGVAAASEEMILSARIDELRATVAESR